MAESQLQAHPDEAAMESDKHEDFSNISLRPIELSDIDDFMVWSSDEKVARNCSWDIFTDKEKGIDYIKNELIPHPWYRVICLNGKPIGAVLVQEFSGNNRCRGELGYVLGSKYWGKGIMPRAVKLAAESVFREWPHLERLEALVDVENVGSQRVLQKAGFTREGVLRKYFILKGKTRDWVMFSLLLDDLQTA